MSNWRINVGLGPVRYVRAIGGSKRKPKGEKKEANPLVGCLVFVVVFVAAMAGFVACMAQAAP